MLLHVQTDKWMLMLRHLAGVVVFSEVARYHVYTKIRRLKIPTDLPSHSACQEIRRFYSIAGLCGRFASEFSRVPGGSVHSWFSNRNSFHVSTGCYPYAYDTAGTDLGNKYKVEKSLKNYDDDATKTFDFLKSLPNCNGRLGATGMCLGVLSYACSL